MPLRPFAALAVHCKTPLARLAPSVTSHSRPRIYAHTRTSTNAHRTMSSTSTSTSTLPPLQRPESLADSTNPAKLHLYTVGTPNGIKVSILLEELVLAYPNDPQLSYDFSALSFANTDQKKPEFLKINPNGRIPALVDDNVTDPATGAGHNVFESASILLWLVENYDKDNKFWFEDKLLRSKALSWIFFAHGGVGPMQGQANHFL